MQTETKQIAVDESELATILAALRAYQRAGYGEPEHRPDWLHNIATNGDECVSLDDLGIDALVERIESGQVSRSQCDCCDESGILPYAGEIVSAPAGYALIERCDACARYADDLAAAQAWGDDAHWIGDDETGRAVVARPRQE